MIARRKLVFISHPDNSAMYARTVRNAFRSKGFDTWLWEDDKPPIGQRDRVIFDAIDGCDYFAHVCTAHTRRSKGQKIERRFAGVLRKQFVLLHFRSKFLGIFKRNFLPSDYVDSDPMYFSVSGSTLHEDCTEVAQWLAAQQDVSGVPTELAEGATLAGSSSLTAEARVLKANRE